MTATPAFSQSWPPTPGSPPSISKVVPQKKPRVRRPKERPTFYRTETTGAIIKLMPITLDDVVSDQINNGGHINARMCPYTKYVPIAYLKSTPVVYNNSTHNVISEVLQRYNSNITLSDAMHKCIDLGVATLSKVVFDGCIRGSCWNLSNPITKIEVSKSLEKYMKTDFPSTFYTRGYSSGLDNMGKDFTTGRLVRARMRSYDASIGFLSAILGGDPYILAVTPRENYRYHRLRQLKGLPIDLSRVIILVDRRLDLPTPDDIPPAFKALYSKTLEPLIKSTPCRIWKVPLEYIKENCLVPKYKITVTTVAERRIERENFLDTFYASLPPVLTTTGSLPGQSMAPVQNSARDMLLIEHAERDRQRQERLTIERVVEEQEQAERSLWERVQREMPSREEITMDDNFSFPVPEGNMTTEERAALAEAVSFMTSTGGA